MNRLKMTITLTVLTIDNIPGTYLRKAIRGHLNELRTDEDTASKTMNFVYGIEDIDGPFNIEAI
jgi:hypothetical protein